MTGDDLRPRLYEVIGRRRLWTRPEHFAANVAYLFGSMEFAGRRMLEIGGGNGLFSVYAACAGAEAVVCLEPEAAGSTAGVRRQFEEILGDLGLSGVRLLPATFQEYDPGDDRFDVILLRNSINHLDEPACIDLHRSEAARETYRGFFRRMHGMARPGATLILADCSRHNFFGSLGLRNPLVPAIEWHKHQPPGLWRRLAGEAGWAPAGIRWKAVSHFGAAGRLLLANRLAAFFMLSHFCLTLRKQGPPAALADAAENPA